MSLNQKVCGVASHDALACCYFYWPTSLRFTFVWFAISVNSTSSYKASYRYPLSTDFCLAFVHAVALKLNLQLLRTEGGH